MRKSDKSWFDPKNEAVGFLYGTIFAAALWTLVWLTYILTAGCQTAPEQSSIQQASLEDGSSWLETERYAHVRVTFPPTPCRSDDGVPYVWFSGRPKVGEPFHVTWTTRPTEPPDYPVYPGVLIVALTPSRPGSLSWWGAPGCWLMVNPQFVLAPSQTGNFHQQGGRFLLDWTPGAGLLGQSFYCQLAVNDRSNLAGWTLSPMLELTIGNR